MDNKNVKDIGGTPAKMAEEAQREEAGRKKDVKAMDKLQKDSQKKIDSNDFNKGPIK